MIEDEIIHWWKDENGESHKNILRIESDEPEIVDGFPRDGLITIRLINSSSNQAIKLNPNEALRISTQLVSIAKELLNKKRGLWRAQFE